MPEIYLPSRGLSAAVDVGPGEIEKDPPERSTAPMGIDVDSDDEVFEALPYFPNTESANQAAKEGMEVAIDQAAQQKQGPLEPHEVAEIAYGWAAQARAWGGDISEEAKDYVDAYVESLPELPGIYGSIDRMGWPTEMEAAMQVAAARKLNQKAKEKAQRKKAVRRVVRVAAVGVPVWAILSAL